MYTQSMKDGVRGRGSWRKQQLWVEQQHIHPQGRYDYMERPLSPLIPMGKSIGPCGPCGLKGCKKSKSSKK